MNQQKSSVSKLIYYSQTFENMTFNNIEIKITRHLDKTIIEIFKKHFPNSKWNLWNLPKKETNMTTTKY